MTADEAEVAASASENHANVGACEVVFFKEEGLAADLREGVGETIAIVQTGAMASPAMQAVGDSSGVRLIGIEANEVDCGAMQPLNPGDRPCNRDCATDYWWRSGPTLRSPRPRVGGARRCYLAAGTMTTAGLACAACMWYRPATEFGVL
jgi:hypothetical protein